MVISVISKEPDTSTTQPKPPSPASLWFGVEHRQPLMISAVFCSFPAKGIIGAEVTEMKVFSEGVKSTADPTMIFFSMDYGKCSLLPLEQQ